MKTPLTRFYVVALYRGAEYIHDARRATLRSCYMTAHHWMAEPGTRVEIHGPFRPTNPNVRRVDKRPNVTSRAAGQELSNP